MLNVYFEIGPLKEREYTGIAQVTAAIAQEIIGDATIRSEFFFGRMIIRKTAVEALLRSRNGELLEWYLQRSPVAPAPRNLNADCVAIFPNRKTARRAFKRECQIIHDLSTLLTPQFHHRDTVAYHSTTLEQDILSNDMTFCVSEATRSDVLSYFPAVRPQDVRTMPLGSSISAGVGEAGGRTVERYILVLGTIEPRKNAIQVLKYLQAHPQFTKKYRVVFLGRFGWGATVDQLIQAYDLQQQYADGRVVFPGFVTEHAKNELIRSARLVVYPSLFEGFGLPVLESAALGIPCVTTRSSSLPEVGGPDAYYFDPFLASDFDRVLMKALVDLEIKGDLVRRRLRNWASKFSWSKTYAIMKSGLQELSLPAEG